MSCENLYTPNFVVRLSFIIRETVRALLKVGSKHIVIGGRNSKFQEEFVAKLKEEQGDAFDTDTQVDGSHTIDLADLQSVKDFGNYVAATYPTIDCLICNAGVMNTPASVTKDGFEQQMGVNVIGHFLLSKLLANQTKRQVWVASYGHTLMGGPRIDIDAIRNFSVDAPYDSFRAYQQSKLGNILLAKEFQKRYSPALETVSLHPGCIFTSLYRETGILDAVKVTASMLPSVILGNVSQVFPKQTTAGASTTVTCATLPSAQLVPGAYYSNCDVAAENEAAKNDEDAAALFEYCEEVTKTFQ
jgi:NAD(P)-dependent dehydrogenase (short-subunit alcohol dehydrogenase family)